MSEGKNKKMNVKQISERLNKENVKKVLNIFVEMVSADFGRLRKQKLFRQERVIKSGMKSIVRQKKS